MKWNEWKKLCVFLRKLNHSQKENWLKKILTHQFVLPFLVSPAYRFATHEVESKRLKSPFYIHGVNTDSVRRYNLFRWHLRLLDPHPWPLRQVVTVAGEPINGQGHAQLRRPVAKFVRFVALVTGFALGMRLPVQLHCQLTLERFRSPDQHSRPLFCNQLIQGNGLYEIYFS